jgi:hypothetical protein
VAAYRIHVLAREFSGEPRTYQHEDREAEATPHPADQHMPHARQDHGCR